MKTPERSPYHHSDEKRRLDVVVSSLALPVTHRIERYVGQRLLQELNDDDGMYYVHKRVQSDGSVVAVKKLRTMHQGHGPSDTELGFSKNNPRIPPSEFVKKVRNARLDELPQIESVRTGETSMVGPRSMDGEWVDFVKSEADRDLFDEWLPATKDMQPGLTGLGQLEWLDEDERPKDVIERVMKADLKYYEHASRRLDLAIMAKTAYRLSRAGLRSQAKRRTNSQ